MKLPNTFKLYDSVGDRPETVSDGICLKLTFPTIFLNESRTLPFATKGHGDCSSEISFATRLSFSQLDDNWYLEASLFGFGIYIMRVKCDQEELKAREAAKKSAMELLKKMGLDVRDGGMLFGDKIIPPPEDGNSK